MKSDSMHVRDLRHAGPDLSEAGKVLIMLHGRGATAEDILSLSQYLDLKDYAIVAPQATNHTWYPYSFLESRQRNEPWISSALRLLLDLTGEIGVKGFAARDIFLLGFSQGACLALEFICRHPAAYGGVAAFTGGLPGDSITAGDYRGDLEGTPVFLSTGDPDIHVPVERVRQTASILQSLNARVTLEIYKNRPHTVSMDETDKAKQIIFR